MKRKQSTKKQFTQETHIFEDGYQVSSYAFFFLSSIANMTCVSLIATALLQAASKSERARQRRVAAAIAAWKATAAARAHE